MATAELPARSGMDAGSIASLANLFLGKTTDSNVSGVTQNSGGTNTTETRTLTNNVAPDAVQAVVNSILQGTQGLAAVASGGARAGLYNSSTNSLMVNDLIARASAEGAKLNSSQTVTTSGGTTDNRATVSTQANKTVTPAQVKPSTAASALGAVQVLGMLSKTSGGQKVADMLGLGSSAKKSALDKATEVSGSNVPTVSTASMDATGNPVSNAQDVGSALPGSEATSNFQSIMPDTPMDYGQGADFSGQDMSFDQSNINGLDLGIDSFGGGGSDIGTDLFGDAGADYGSSIGGDWGPDPTSIDYTDYNTDFSDMFNWAEGGMVTKHGNETLLKRKYAGGGYVNLAAEKAFASGGDEPTKDSTPARTRDSGVDFYRQNPAAAPAPAPSEADTYHPNKSLAVRLVDRIMGRDKKPGYAEGGLVTPDLTNTGLRVADTSTPQGMGTVGGEQIVSGILKSKQSINAGGQGNLAAAGSTAKGTGSTNTAGTGGASNGTRKVNNSRDKLFDPNGGENTEGPPGQVGTPESNQAAINGAVALGLTTALGVPGVVGNVAMNALGIPNINMNPVSQLVSLVTGLVGPEGMTAAANTAAAANTSPTASDDNAAVANGIAADNNSDPLDALVGIVSDPSPITLGTPGSNGDANDGTSAEGGGIGGSGNSAGDSNSGDGGDGSGAGPGGGGDGGGGTASAKNGGMIRGPGTPTSDSIDAKLSDGEYVIKAAAVDHWGKDFFDMLNNAVSPSSGRG